MGLHVHRAAEDLQALLAHVAGVVHAAAAVLLEEKGVHRRVVPPAVLQDLVPLGVDVAPGLEGDGAARELGEARRGGRRGQAVHHVAAALPVGAVGLDRLEAGVGRRLEDPLLLAAHRPDHAVEAVELGVQDRALELAGPRPVGDKARAALGPPAPVEAAGVDGAADALGDGRRGS